MRESILTIPINEVFEKKCGCPLCSMRDELEQHSVEYIMGAAMMEPDVRIETNKTGFCKVHFEQMRACKNRLSLALMLQTHLQELQKHVFDEKKFLETKEGKAKRTTEKVGKIVNDCFVCNKIEWAMSRLLSNMFDLYAREREFRQLYAEQEYLCLPHFKILMTAAETGTDTVGRKYVSRLTLRVTLTPGSRLRVYVRYDSAGDYVLLADLRGSAERTCSVPLRPRRCDRFCLRFEGFGDAVIHSVQRTTEGGSELT